MSNISKFKGKLKVCSLKNIKGGMAQGAMETTGTGVETENTRGKTVVSAVNQTDCVYIATGDWVSTC